MSYTKATEQKATRNPSWTNISGEMTVFGKKRTSKNGGEFLGYSTSVGKKQEDGTYKNCFFNVRFGKDNNPEKEGAFTIQVHKAFLTVDVYEERVSPVIVITDFDFV